MRLTQSAAVLLQYWPTDSRLTSDHIYQRWLDDINRNFLMIVHCRPQQHWYRTEAAVASNLHKRLYYYDENAFTTTQSWMLAGQC